MLVYTGSASHTESSALWVQGDVGLKVVEGLFVYACVISFFQEFPRMHPGEIHLEGACLGEVFSAAIVQARRSGLGVLVSLPLSSHFCLCS